MDKLQKEKDISKLDLKGRMTGRQDAFACGYDDSLMKKCHDMFLSNNIYKAFIKKAKLWRVGSEPAIGNNMRAPLAAFPACDTCSRSLRYSQCNRHTPCIWSLKLIS